MPSADAILRDLSLMASTRWPVAVVWHGVLLLALLLALLPRLRPSRRLAAALCALPLISAGGLAALHGNPFNAIMLLALSAHLVLSARRIPEGALEAGPGWARALGAVTLAYGWVYPHFLSGPAMRYLVAAPVGIVPCATLAVVVGLALLAGAFQSRRWSLPLALVALFYGLFGVLRLGVALDLGLTLGALALFACALGITGRATGERARIDAFLALKRIALVGASRDSAHFSRMVMRELLGHGIDVVPVHPDADRIEGRVAFPTLERVEPPVEGALVMTPAAASAAVVKACAAAGIARVWLHRGAGTGAVSAEAVQLAERLGLTLVAGRCPLMFLGEHPAAVHRAHAGVLRLLGRYPAR